jgi:hypothetical protein
MTWVLWQDWIPCSSLQCVIAWEEAQLHSKPLLGPLPPIPSPDHVPTPNSLQHSTLHEWNEEISDVGLWYIHQNGPMSTIYLVHILLNPNPPVCSIWQGGIVQIRVLCNSNTSGCGALPDKRLDSTVSVARLYGLQLLPVQVHLHRHGIRGKSMSKLIFNFSPLDIST